MEIVAARRLCAQDAAPRANCFISHEEVEHLVLAPGPSSILKSVRGRDQVPARRPDDFINRHVRAGIIILCNRAAKSNCPRQDTPGNICP
jgi:hypothetical protein